MRCRTDDRVGDLRGAIDRSPYGFALVTSARGVLLGRVRRSALECDENLLAEDVMEPGPSTVRPDRRAGKLAEHLARSELRYAIVTTPEGKLLGVVRREDLENAR